MATRFTLAVPLLLGLAAGGALPAFAQERVIGVAAPSSGPTERLGAQVLAGARAALPAGSVATLVTADTACTAEGGREAATRLIAAKARIVTGFLCTEALEAALPLLTAANVPTITSGVRAARLTDRRAKTGALLWRVAPRSDAQAAALVRAVETRWRSQPFGLVEDGTVDGRGLADALRARLEASGTKPLLLDTYRPADEKQFGLVRRILASGVTRLVVAGDRPDIAIIARDATESGLSLEIVGGEQLFDEPGPVPLPAGILAVAPLWRFPDMPSNDGQEAREGYFGPSLVATEIALAALAEAERGRRSLPDVLGTTRFATSLGPASFDAKGDVDLDLYRTFRFDGSAFAPDAGG